VLLLLLRVLLLRVLLLRVLLLRVLLLLPRVLLLQVLLLRVLLLRIRRVLWWILRMLRMRWWMIRRRLMLLLQQQAAILLLQVLHLRPHNLLRTFELELVSFQFLNLLLQARNQFLVTFTGPCRTLPIVGSFGRHFAIAARFVVRVVQGGFLSRSLVRCRSILGTCRQGLSVSCRRRRCLCILRFLRDGRRAALHLHACLQRSTHAPVVRRSYYTPPLVASLLRLSTDKTKQRINRGSGWLS
jgi:hypothetical protein